MQTRRYVVKILMDKTMSGVVGVRCLRMKLRAVSTKTRKTNKEIL